MKRYYITRDFGNGIYNMWYGRPCYSKFKCFWANSATSKHMKIMCVRNFERINDIRLKGGPRSIIEIKGFKVIPAKDGEEGLWLVRYKSAYRLFYTMSKFPLGFVESFCGTEFELMTDILKLGEKDKIKIKGFKTIRVKKTINKL